MPAYFKFLTLMAFHVFIEEKVDVAVVEVGIGGEYDCTNVIRHPIVCGVTTLDYDHTALLGKTLPEIAWQKAGIFKSGSEAIVVDQTEEALSVMVERARERKCILHVAPRFDEYDWPSDSMDFGIKGRHQYPNISLAMQLVKVWMERTARKENLVLQNQIDNNHQNLVLPPFPIPNEFLDGLRLCEWPGRSQVIQNRGIVFYLDGAHTQKSVEYCSQWFDTERRELEKKLGGSFLRVLLFHCTADRTPDSLLPYFKSAGFDIAVFCPARLNSIVDPSSDQANFNSNENSEVEKVNASECVWRKVNGKSSTVKRFSCITEAFNYITSLSKQETRKIEVLVTGSLHLIGGVLSLITPD
ncbi:hypothetical protein AB6A40_010349 [Gnathostoma spinigerum]|uniref:tetrahydrofolate synthase n=1 Tax=Gnathostoma spinigerum TaxID=75299 RepID=A0ABD6F359_9BILA